GRQGRAAMSAGVRGEVIYPDLNATTPVAPDIIDAMMPLLRERFGTPSSGHVLGRRARVAWTVLGLMEALHEPLAHGAGRACPPTSISPTTGSRP
ncbi:MAG: hypothetical protein ACYCV7_16900, partial [Acidimicrobiales bacterium]